METINDLCDSVRQTGYDIHVYHGNGHLEKVYENALAHRFQIRKYAFSLGRVTEEGSGKVARFLPFLCAFLSFFRG